MCLRLQTGLTSKHSTEIKLISYLMEILAVLKPLNHPKVCSASNFKLQYTLHFIYILCENDSGTISELVEALLLHGYMCDSIKSFTYAYILEA